MGPVRNTKSLMSMGFKMEISHLKKTGQASPSRRGGF